MQKSDRIHANNSYNWKDMYSIKLHNGKTLNFTQIGTIYRSSKYGIYNDAPSLLDQWDKTRVTSPEFRPKFQL